MKSLLVVYTHPYVYWIGNMVCAKHHIPCGSSLGMITGVPRAFHHTLFLHRGCFYMHSEMILDARYTQNPLAWILDGFFDDMVENVRLIPLCNDEGFIYGLDVIATMDIQKDDIVVYHTLLPI